jgi:hypothetical protein
MALVVIDFILERYFISEHASKRREMRSWLKEHVGPSLDIADRIGEGWRMFPRLNQDPSRKKGIQWCVEFDDDTLAVAFKLSFA